jgi:hypothetical protein
LKGLNLDSRSRHPGNVQASKDDEDLQELLFMEKRLQNIFENNQVIHDVENSDCFS